MKRIKNTFLDYINDRGGIGVFLDFLSVASFVIAICTLNWFHFELYAFIILALLLMLITTNIAHFCYRKNSVRLKDLYYNNVPLISTMTYLIQTRGRNFEHSNDLTVRRVSIRYAFWEKEDKAFQNDSLDIARQKFTYVFHGSNDTNKDIYSFSMNFIKSVFANFYNARFSAKCMINRQEALECCEPRIKRLSSLRDFVTVEFRGAGIRPKQEFTLEISKESAPSSFRTVEHFLIDPEQYTDGQVTWNVELQSNSETIKKRDVTLLELDRNTFVCKMRLCNKVKFADFNSYFNNNYASSNALYSKRNRVYLLRIEPPKEHEGTTLDWS